MTIGGGGLAAGVGAYIKTVHPETKVIGVEPLGAASMTEAIDQKQVVTLQQIDKFVDGAAVKRVGDLTYDICKNALDDILKVPEGKACTTILELYNENAIVVEPAGSLSVAALAQYKDQIQGKKSSASSVGAIMTLTGCKRLRNVRSCMKGSSIIS